MNLKKGNKVLCVENNSTVRPLVIESIDGDKILFSKQLDKGVKKTFSLKKGSFQIIKPRYLSEHEKKDYINPELETHDRVKIVHVSGSDEMGVLGKNATVVSVVENSRNDREVSLWIDDMKAMVTLHLQYRKMAPNWPHESIPGELIQKDMVYKLDDKLKEHTEWSTEETSPELEVGDRIMAWDIEPDMQAPGEGHTEEVPSTFIATVQEVLEVYDPEWENGIRYIVKIEDTDEVLGLYGGEIIRHRMGSGEFVWEGRDKWLKLPKIGITEDSDIFGQGLLDPIEPEEFEGEEEEWDELVGDVEDDPFEEEPRYEYEGGTTDPATGFVAPSAEVTDNICRVKGFCEEQGPITFGQLRELVEEATKKRIRADIGRGIFKTVWRIIPFFIPQVLLAAVGVTVTRAFNKIITPALTDTRGYKAWWGKVVLKAMDVAEGDYIPDVALGDDPLSRIFFISDGLMQMIRDKYKLKFARYVAEYASTRPDDEAVPEWFVENLLRDYLNQKFLLEPPLEPKEGTDFKTLREHNEEGGELDEFEGYYTSGPFSRMDIKVLNHVVQEFTKDELYKISTQESENISSDLTDKWSRDTILFGESPGDWPEGWIKSTRYAKWAIDNWDGAGAEDFGDDSMDFSRVTNPIKAWPSMFEVEGNESYWEKIYRSGSIEIPAWNADDAEERAHNNWYEYDPEMEAYDYGDTDDHDLDIGDVHHIKTIKEEKENINPPIEVGDKIVLIDKIGEDTLYSEVRPELYTPYVIVDKTNLYSAESGGKKVERFQHKVVKVDDYEYYKEWLERGADEVPSPQKVLYPWLYRWIPVDRKTITEHKQPGLNPDLEEGDTIVVIDIDREREDGKTQYTTPGSEMRPERYTPYTVVEKKISGGKSKWPFNYILVPEGQVEAYEKSLGRGWGNYEGYEKLLYPWIYQWIYADTPMANNVDRKTISEHKESKLNPELMVGDEVLVTGTENIVNAPELYMPYVVVDIKQSNNTQEIYYGLDLLDPPDLETAIAQQIRIKDLHLHQEDSWIFHPGFKREETITKPKKSKLNPQLMVGDEIMVVSTEGIHDFGIPELYKPYVVVGIKHGTTIMKGGKELEDYPYYQIEPVGMTDEERTGAMLAGGGRMKPLYLYPKGSSSTGGKNDQWILRPGFLRGELNEQQFPFIPSNKETQRDHPKGEPDWSIRRGRQHYAMNVEDTRNESVTAFNNYLVKNSPFNFLAFDYYITAVPDHMPDSALIDVFIPMLDTGKNADELWSGKRITYYEDLGIDDYDYDYEEEEDAPYIRQNVLLRDIPYNERYGEYYEEDERFRDTYPEEVLKYDNRETDYLNYPGALYNRSWLERFNELRNEMEEIGKLFGIERISINRYPDRPWSRRTDSYGNQNIRPGKDVPRNLKEHEEKETDREIQYAVQDIVDKVYPHIANNLGKSTYVDETPRVELWKDIYARYSGIEGMEGEHSSTSKAEYDDYDNTIYIYYPNMEDVEDIIRSLLHEYTHSLQDPDERKGHREEGYEKDPDEIEAAEAELNWEDYLRYLQENLNEQNFSAHYFQGHNNMMLKSPELEQDLKAFHGLEIDKEEELDESVPQPGSSSAEGFDDKDLPYETEYLTLDEILSRVKNIAYYKEVLRDLQDDKDDWGVTQTVKRYADYWMENPESLTGPDFPPIQVIGDGMKDGSHRISTLNALANYIDIDNPYWKEVKLEVRFYDPEMVMGSGHFYPWLWDISDEDLQQAIDDKVYNWEVLEKWLADPNAKEDLKKLRAESINEHKESNSTTPSLNSKIIKILKYIFEFYDIQGPDYFIQIVRQVMNSEMGSILWLYLKYNASEIRRMTILELLNNVPAEEYEIPTIYNYEVVYYLEYESSQVEEECDSEGYGEQTSDECECIAGEKIVEDKDGNETSEECEDDELEDIHYDVDKCDCTEWDYKEYETWYWTTRTSDILSYTKLENTDEEGYTFGYNEFNEIDFELGNETTYIILSQHDDDGFDEAEMWDYFDDSKEDEIIGLDSDIWHDEVEDVIERINSDVHKKKNIEEQFEMATQREHKMKDLTSQIFKVLDDSFDILPNPEGEIEYDGKKMALYSYSHESFVDFEYVYNPIIQMLEGGIQQEDIEIFVEIITNWVNYVMSEKREYVNEEVNIKNDNSNYSQEDYENFVDFAHKELKIDKDCPIDVETEPSSEYTTGNYHIKDRKIKILDNGRKLADILRTIAHELVHHKQNELGQLVGDIPEIGGPIEDQANAYAGRLVKKYGKQKPNLYTESKKNLISEEKMVNFDSPVNNFVVIAGGPGAGKSFITNNLINLNNVRSFNVDQVRVMTAKKLWGDEWEEMISTPEGYQKILDMTYTTSDPRNLTVRYLKNFLIQDRDNPVNVIYDAGGGQEQVMRDVHRIAKESGMVTNLVYVRTPLELAQIRNDERPRSLPDEMVAQYHQKVKDNMRDLIPIFDHVWIVDNKELIDLSNRPAENIEKIK